MTATDHAARKHYRVGPGRCACGFDAYKLNGIMLDYHELLMSHLREAPKRDKAARKQEAAASVATDHAAVEQAAKVAHDAYFEGDYDHISEIEKHLWRNVARAVLNRHAAIVERLQARCDELWCAQGNGFPLAPQHDPIARAIVRGEEARR